MLYAAQLQASEPWAAAQSIPYYPSPCVLKPESFLACTSVGFGSYELLAVQAYGNIAGWQSARSWKEGKETYRGMVEVSSALMKARQDANPVFTGHKSSL